MAKVRMISRNFLADHPKAGQPTFFVEKFLNSFNVEMNNFYFGELRHLNPDIPLWDLNVFYSSLKQWVTSVKSHTVRNNEWFKKGDKISIRCWIGEPYHSKTIKLLPDIEVKNTWKFESAFGLPFIEDQYIGNEDFERLAYNDGLTPADMQDWFGKPFKGQIICWNDKIKY